MKKLFCLAICLITVFVNTVYVNAEDIYIPCIEEKMEIPGTTPKEAAVFDMLGSATDIDISIQIYDNILMQAPDMFLLTDNGINEINPWEAMDNNELVRVKSKAAEIMAGCETADERIYAVAKYVATNVCYDYDYLYHNAKKYEDLNHNAYDVLTNETAVCYGYATAASALLQCVGIPCILVHSPDHVWNMAYNGERWILFDTTWMSYNRFEYGVKNKSTSFDMRWYDYTIDYANSNYNHIVTDADYAEYDNGIYSFPVYSKIESFEIPQYITTVGEFAFNQCKKIKLTFNGIFENVEKCAFQSCTLLQGVVNLSNIENLGNHAFFECASITDIILGNGISKIPEAAFYSCNNLKNIVMYPSVTYIDDFAFAYCNSLSAIYYYGTQSDWNRTYIGANNSVLRNPPVIYNYAPSIRVTRQGTVIYKISFTGIPFSEIVALAEYKSGELTNVVYQPLQRALSFDVSNNNDEVKLFVFENHSSMRPLIENNLATGTLYFNNESNGNISIVNAEITECLDGAGYVDYDKVTVKAQINASDAVDDIVVLLSGSSDDELSECIYLNQIDMPQNKTVEFTVAKEKIANALGLEDLEDCSLYLKIGGTGIKKSVSETLFYEEDLNEEEHGFCYNRLTGEIEIFTNGDMVDYALASAVPWHAHAANIKSINIDNGVTRIGNNSFADCTSLTSVKISRNVQSIGKYAFRRAENLVEVRIPSKITVLEEGVFDGCSENLVIFCPEGSNADEYARLHGITVSYISAGIPGDADGNESITIRDAAIILQYIAGWDVSIDESIADADGNNSITIRDAALILQYIAGWNVTLGQ